MLIQAAPLFEIAAQLRSGERDLLATVQEALDRLERIEPEIQAFVSAAESAPDRRERLMREAAALQAQYPDPASRPPLYGVLIGVKDIFRADGFETRAGSTLPPALFAGDEAPVVTRLKSLGALVLGKTVTATFAYIDPNETRNPHNTAHTPGGSSSGSAAAVAAGVCLLALGTQTIGSVIRPASYCGVIGFKPGHGRISTAGVIPVSAALDHVGLFTQDVDGMRLAASLVIDDWRMIKMSGDKPVLGVIEGAYLEQAEPEMIAAFEATVARLARAGFTIQRINPLEDIRKINEQAAMLMAHEAARVHGKWYAAYSNKYPKHITDMFYVGLDVKPPKADEFRDGQATARTHVQTMMRENGIDVWVSPAATGAAPHGLGSTGNSIMNLPWSFTGMPAITMPMGKDENGLPLGLQLSAAYGDDERLMAWAGMVADHIGT